MATARPVPTTAPAGRLQGIARADRRTKNLAKRLRPGDIAVLDHADLDSLAARALAEARIAAVVNARPFITGKYPNRGPALLLAARIPLFQMDDPDGFACVVEGQSLTVDEEGVLFQGSHVIAGTVRWDDAAVAAATEAARANLSAELEKFARNTLQYLEADKELLLEPTDVPEVPGLKIGGRHVLIVVRGDGYKEDLKLLRAFIQGVEPVLLAVDGGADALLELGYRPDIILGDMDSVSDTALRCGACLIVHAYARRSGDAPGLARLEALGLPAGVFPVAGTSEDAALLLAYEHGADLIVTVGTHSNLEDFLDKGRAGMASTFLVRLKVGQRLVDARGVYKLYRPAVPFSAFAAVLLCALFPTVVMFLHAPLWRNMLGIMRLWWRLHFH